MFRTLRAGGRVLGLSRLPLRVQSQSLHEPAPRIQKVRFYEPFRPRHFLASCLAIGVGYEIFVHVALAPLDKLAEELEAEDAKQGVDQDEEDDASLFLPFPGTIKKIKPAPYKGNDPEWLEFVKFSKSQELNVKVRADLAHLVHKICEQTIAPQMRVDKRNMKVNRYWLDIDYPYDPPPEFERSGIEVSDSHISWTARPVDSLTVLRIKHILWPSAVTQSLFSFWKVLLSQNSSKLYEVLGIKTEGDKQSMQRIEQSIARTAEILGSKRSPIPKDGISNSTTRNPQNPPTPQAPSAAGPRGKMGNSPGGQSKSAVNHSGLNKAEMERVGPGQDSPTYVAMKLHMLRAFLAFRTKLAQTWKPVPNYPPRGSLFVSGFIELDTPQAWIVVDVIAAWDPKTRTFDDKSMHLRIRRLQPKSQNPKGR